MRVYTYRITLSVLCTAVLLFNCTVVDNTAGVTDIPNEKVAGMVVYKENLQTASTKVIMRKIVLTSTGDSIISEIVTTPDGLGRYNFDKVKNGVYVVYTCDTVKNMSAVISKLHKGDNELVNQDLFLEDNISIKGRILTKSSSPKPIKVFIPGLDIVSDIDSLGYYRLEKVPNGQYDIGFIYNNTVSFLSVKTTGNSDTVFIRDAQIDSSAGRIYNFFESNTNNVFSIDPLIYEQDPDWYIGKDFFAASYYTINNDGLIEVDETGKTALLLDNFNDNDELTELYTVFPDIVWYGWNDVEEDGGSTVVIPDITAPNSFEKCIEPVEGMGKAVHVKFIFGDKFMYPYAGIGCKNQTTGKYFIDLSKMTAISFHIKGSGRIRVAFSSKKVDDLPEEQRWGDLQKSFELPAEWQKITIPVSELTPPPYSLSDSIDLTWEDVRDSIRSIHFENTVDDTFGDTTEMWLDNIFLHGIGSFDLEK